MAATKKQPSANQDKATGKFVKGNTAAAKKKVENEIKGIEIDETSEPETKERIRKYAQSKSMNALKTIDQIMRGKDTKPADKLKCAELLLAYAHGKPGTSSDEAETDIKITMEGVDEYSI